MFIGLLDNEKRRKNRVIINIICLYRKNRGFLDYKVLYDKIIQSTESKKWGSIESFLEETAGVLMKDFRIIDSLTISLTKYNPMLMPNSPSVTASYTKKRKK